MRLSLKGAELHEFTYQNALLSEVPPNNLVECVAVVTAE